MENRKRFSKNRIQNWPRFVKNKFFIFQKQIEFWKRYKFWFKSFKLNIIIPISWNMLAKVSCFKIFIFNQFWINNFSAAAANNYLWEILIFWDILMQGICKSSLHFISNQRITSLSQIKEFMLFIHKLIIIEFLLLLSLIIVFRFLRRNLS